MQRGNFAAAVFLFCGALQVVGCMHATPHTNDQRAAARREQRQAELEQQWDEDDLYEAEVDQALRREEPANERAFAEHPAGPMLGVDPGITPHAASPDGSPTSSQPGDDVRPVHTASDQPDADQAISNAVSRVLSSNAALSHDAQSVQVETENGVVTIRGRVRSQDERTLIRTQAERVAGVVRVVDETQLIP